MDTLPDDLLLEIFSYCQKDLPTFILLNKRFYRFIVKHQHLLTPWSVSHYLNIRAIHSGPCYVNKNHQVKSLSDYKPWMSVSARSQDQILFLTDFIIFIDETIQIHDRNLNLLHALPYTPSQLSHNATSLFWIQHEELIIFDCTTLQLTKFKTKHSKYVSAGNHYILIQKHRDYYLSPIHRIKFQEPIFKLEPRGSMYTHVRLIPYSPDDIICGYDGYQTEFYWTSCQHGVSTNTPFMTILGVASQIKISSNLIYFHRDDQVEVYNFKGDLFRSFPIKGSKFIVHQGAIYY